MRVRHVCGTRGKRRTVWPSLPLYYVSDFDVIEGPDGKSPRETGHRWRRHTCGPHCRPLRMSENFLFGRVRQGSRGGTVHVW